MQSKTRQDKPSQAKPSQAKTRQDKTTPNKTKQDTTRQDTVTYTQPKQDDQDHPVSMNRNPTLDTLSIPDLQPDNASTKALQINNLI